MANPEHLQILHDGVARWNRWRSESSGVRPDLVSAQFSQTDLTNVDFRAANLTDTNFREASFRGADFTGALLRWANLQNADLSGAALGGAVLTRANLHIASLNGADLTRAVLSSANLSGADLGHATLREAGISEADLSDALLTSADLRCANLQRAILHGTVLYFTDLSEAEFGHTVLSDVDLSKAKGLETVQHRGPSSISLDTLYKSEGKIPESFLRGCGVPEEFIRYAPGFLNQPIQFYSCFISYSHQDKGFARLLHDRLQERGIRCWLDEHQLLPGDDLHEGIDRGIRLWDKVLLFASKASLTSWWVDGEINRAFQKEAQVMKERGKKVLALIPLNLDRFLFSTEYQSGKKAEITSRVAANFVGWEKDHALFDRELKKVIRALRTDEAGREKPPASQL